jgi:signal recognition particle GTPase
VRPLGLKRLAPLDLHSKSSILKEFGLFESLQSRLGGVFDKLRGRGALTEADVDAALREVRTALIEADVALPVVKDFVEKVRPRAIGESVIRSRSSMTCWSRRWARRMRR